MRGRPPKYTARMRFMVEVLHLHGLSAARIAEVMKFYGVPATCRASLAFYNTHEEIEHFVAALGKVRKLLA